MGVFLSVGPLEWLSGTETADSFELEPDKEIVPAPQDPVRWPEYRQQLVAWRDLKRHELAYDDALYHLPQFAWTARDFSCCFLMMCDEQFYDPASGQYSVHAFLEHGRERFGGYDSVVLWQAYPRIGLDNRNQFDFYRDMPGGMQGLRSVVDQLHQAGVKAFIDYNPWDTGTRREGREDVDVLCDMVRELDADGIFLDTMAQGASDARAKLDAARPGVALESELALAVSSVHDHHLSWAQWFRDSEVPGVLRNKWFERRHMQHQIHRWNIDHTGELQSAWMNGSGMMVWENVFGSWVGWSQRDQSILRTMLAIQRRFAQLWITQQWTPLVPTLQSDVYANLWEADGVRLWTLVNRSMRTIEGPLFTAQRSDNERCYDLVAGGELVADNTIRGSMAPRGIGCFLVAEPGKLDPDFAKFLRGQKQLATRSSLDSSFPAIDTQLKNVEPTQLCRACRRGWSRSRVLRSN